MLRIGIAAVCALMSTGCASIVSGQNQSLSVLAQKSGTDTPGAKCSLTNDKGAWYVTAPGSVTVRRSYNDLLVNCAVDGTDPGILTVKSSTKGMAFGNILFGGVIGAGVDMSTGAAYDYPDVITVQLGKVATLAPPAAAASAAAPAPAAPATPAAGTTAAAESAPVK